MNVKKYSKLIAAAVGLVAILLGPDFLGLTNDAERLAQAILALLTLFGVYQVRNTT